MFKHGYRGKPSEGKKYFYRKEERDRFRFWRARWIRDSTADVEMPNILLISA
jgi:hypothetical protein